MHKHHIIPRHLGGTNDPDNLVEVSVKEHAEIHRCLWVYGGRWQDEMAYRTLAGLITREDAQKEIVRKVMTGNQYWKKRSKVWNKGMTKDTDRRVARKSKEMIGNQIAKGHKRWHTGLTKETDFRVAEISKKLTGRKRPGIGGAPKGRTPWNKGLTKETDNRVAAYGRTRSNKNKKHR